MSCQIRKAGVVDSKILTTKWDVKCIDSLTRADFYTDNFQPRDAFLIPQGVAYPNERTMLKAMNKTQRGLKNGNGKEWHIVQGRRGSRMVCLYDPGEAPVKDRTPPPDSCDVTRELAAKSQLQRKDSINGDRSHKTEAKRSEASPAPKKAQRSIFTVHERRKDIQGQNRQEAGIGSMPPREAVMEKCDLEETRGKTVSTEVGVKENVCSKMDPRKSYCVSEKDNKKHELSHDDRSDEKYDFADYQENNSEPSLFDTDSNNCDNLVSKHDHEPTTMVRTIQSDNMAEMYVPPVDRSRRKHGMMKTGLGKGDQKGIEGSSGEGISFATNHQIDTSKGFPPPPEYDLTVNEIEEDVSETVGFDVKPKKDTSKEMKSVAVKGSQYNAQRSQGNICQNTRNKNENSLLCYKPLRKEPPATVAIGSNHTVNQRKKNAEIDRENNRLCAKLDLIKGKPNKNSISFRTSRQEQLPFARIQRRISTKSIDD